MSKPWTDEELARLRELVGRGWAASRIARDIDRPEQGVKWKIHDLRLRRRYYKPRLDSFHLP